MHLILEISRIIRVARLGAHAFGCGARFIHGGKIFILEIDSAVFSGIGFGWLALLIFSGRSSRIPFSLGCQARHALEANRNFPDVVVRGAMGFFLDHAVTWPCGE